MKLSMSKIHGIKKPRGRPKLDTEPVTVRLSHDVLNAIEEARRDMPVIPTRPEVVRTALIDWLKAKKYLKP